MSTTTTRSWTYDDLLSTPNDGLRYEIIGGELFVSPSPATKHQRLSGRFFALLLDLEKAGLGVVFAAPTDVKFSDQDTVVPDLLFIRTEHQHIIGPNYITGPPDLIIEILSPSNSAVDRERKLALYAAAGVPEYWMLDPETESVVPLTLVEDHYELIPVTGGIVRSVVLPEFVVELAALFAGLS